MDLELLTVDDETKNEMQEALGDGTWNFAMARLEKTRWEDEAECRDAMSTPVRLGWSLLHWRAEGAAGEETPESTPSASTDTGRG